MERLISRTPEENGQRAADCVAEYINAAIQKRGHARILLSTGASQFEFFEALIKKEIDWTRVEGFHLDEYLGISIDHPASFRKYLKERFVYKTGISKFHYINVEGDIEDEIEKITVALRSAPIDVGVIGIGVNAHIAFNDPPADVETDVAFKVVELDETCRKQQFDEGWFETLALVPQFAVTMTVKEILKCKAIVSCVPHAVKAQAVYDTLTHEISNLIPSTYLKTHPDWTLFLDAASSKKLDQK